MTRVVLSMNLILHLCSNSTTNVPLDGGCPLHRHDETPPEFIEKNEFVSALTDDKLLFSN